MSAVSTYAEALFGAAREREEIEEVLQDLQEFAGVLDENEELRLFFYSTQIAEREKRGAIDGLTEDMRLSTRNFLKLLSDNGRAEILEDVVRRYEALVEEHFGRVEVRVTTAVELSEGTLERIRDRLEKILGDREVILETSVDPDILGGAVFTLGQSRVDSSVRGQLDGLRDRMIERGVV